MSGSRWVILPSWLSGSWRSFLNSCLYSCHIFLISSASFRSIPFPSFIDLIFAWNVPLLSLLFLKRSLVFPILLFSSISLHWALRKAFLSLLAIIWNSAFKWVYLSFSPLLFTSLLFTENKVGKTTRPFRYDLNQIAYDYTVEVKNIFRGLDLIKCLDEPWTEVHAIVQETGIKTIPRGKKMKKKKKERIVMYNSEWICSVPIKH